MSDPKNAPPWFALYNPTRPQTLVREFSDALGMFRATVSRAAAKPAVAYFDATLTFAELDEQSDALASALLANGFSAGDRLGLYLQNTPHFVIGVLAAWKAGGIAVPINPMNRARELSLILEDSQATALLAHGYLHRDVAGDVLAKRPHTIAISADERDYQTRDDARVLPTALAAPAEGTLDFTELIRAHAGRTPPAVTYAPNDTALLVYTLGTTGLPKGAMNSHGNLTFNAQAFRDWTGIEASDPIHGIAPLFHITGLTGGMALAAMNASPLILHFRFHPAVAVEAIREHRAAFVTGAITAFIALMNLPGIKREHLATLTRVFSGGAPIPPSVVEEFERRFGLTIHTGYGLTETTAPATLQPLGRKAPVDAASGSLAIGVPIYDTTLTIVDDDGRPLTAGEVGEIAVEGPQVAAGYWRNPDETARTFPERRLLTGDVGFMDDAGFFYIVDRKKDMINCAGYKVWPREVEDVLYGHPAVREAAVIGVPDGYRGESVRAIVSLKTGANATPAEIVAFCKDRMAAYKYPREVEIVDELPKTVSGKILRRELRDAAKVAVRPEA